MANSDFLYPVARLAWHKVVAQEDPNVAHAVKVTKRRLQHAEQHAKCASLFTDVGDTVAVRDAMIARMHATRAHKLRNTLHLLINGVMPRG